MQVVAKLDARNAGLSRYFTGDPCKRGHICERVVATHDCVECLDARRVAWANANKAKVNASSRSYYRRNTEKAKKVRASWRERNSEKDRADIAAYQAANAEKLAVAAKLWRERNPEKVKATVAKSLAKHRQKRLEKDREWRRNNRDKINAKKMRREARKLQATPSWTDPKAMAAIYRLASQTSRATGISHHVDHIVPLRSKFVCGLHCEANLQVIPGVDNQKKSNRYWPDGPSLKEG